MRLRTRLVMPVLALVLETTITGQAVAQYGQIRLFDDPEPQSCSLVDDVNTIRNVYVVHTFAVNGASAAQFGIQAGPGVTMTYLAFSAAPGMISIAQGPGSISVAYGSCMTGIFHIGTLQYLAYGTSTLCSSINVVADPISPIPGSVVAIDCSFTARSVTAGRMDINPHVGCAQPCAEDYSALPVVKSIEDVPNDQGKQVSIEWWRSGRDQPASPTPITQYGVYRQIDEDLATSFSRDVASPNPVSRAMRATPPGNWHFLGVVPARGDNQYALVVPTLKDSTTTDGMYRSVFFISALTTNPVVYFDSPIDSGYSVDNLQPNVPSSFVIAYNTGHGNDLSWESPTDPDVQYYKVYRSIDGGLAASAFELVAVTVEDSWTDPDFDGWQVDYRVAAVDFGGNESELAGPSQPPTRVNDVPPASFQLRPNVPNPFSGTTAIVYDVPRGGGEMQLAVYDVRGSLVRQLAAGMATEGAGRVVWDGRDRDSRLCASGVYFVRLSSPRGESIRKVVLTR